MKNQYISQDGFNKICDTRKELRKRADELVEQITLNRSQESGDESENSEYMRLLSEINGVRNKEAELAIFCASCIIVDISKNKQDGVVRFGSFVEVEDLNTEEIEKYQILGALEAEPKEKIVSYLSPLGAALIGKKVGDIIVFDAPSGEKEMEIVSVNHS